MKTLLYKNIDIMMSFNRLSNNLTSPDGYLLKKCKGRRLNGTTFFFDFMMTEWFSLILVLYSM